MEANLTNLESKLDALLAAFEQLEEEEKGGKNPENEAPNQQTKPDEKWRVVSFFSFSFCSLASSFFVSLLLSFFGPYTCVRKRFKVHEDIYEALSFKQIAYIQIVIAT